MTDSIPKRNTFSPCRHCRVTRMIRSRGLCGRCHRTPAIKARYPIAVRTLPDMFNVKPRPCRPTTAGPGTEEKIRVMAERFRRGEAIFHPSDPRLTFRADA